MGPDGSGDSPRKLPKNKSLTRSEDFMTKRGRRTVGAKKVHMGDFVVLSDDEDDGYECTIFSSDSEEEPKDRKKKKGVKKEEKK